MPEYHSGPELNFQRKESRELSLSKLPHVRLAEIGVFENTGIEAPDALIDLALAQLETLGIPFIKSEAVLADSIQSIPFQIKKHFRDDPRALRIAFEELVSALFQQLHARVSPVSRQL